MENVHDTVAMILDLGTTDLTDDRGIINLTDFSNEVCHEHFGCAVGDLSPTEQGEFRDAVAAALDEEDQNYE